MSVADLDEVYKCRAVLEGLVASEAAQAADEETLASLRALLEEMAAAVAEEDIATFFERNVAFTRALHEASGNRTLMRVVSGLEKQALRYRYLAHQRTREIVDLALAGDRKVFEAVAARKPERAEREAVKMIRDAHRIIARVVGEVDPSEWLSETGAQTSPA